MQVRKGRNAPLAVRRGGKAHALQTTATAVVGDAVVDDDGDVESVCCDTSSSSPSMMMVCVGGV